MYYFLLKGVFAPFSFQRERLFFVACLVCRVVCDIWRGEEWQCLEGGKGTLVRFSL